jgi:hypothetical protein
VQETWCLSYQASSQLWRFQPGSGFWWWLRVLLVEPSRPICVIFVNLVVLQEFLAAPIQPQTARGHQTHLYCGNKLTGSELGFSLKNHASISHYKHMCPVSNKNKNSWSVHIYKLCLTRV